MKAIVINHYGGIDELHLREYPKPMPKRGEVLIEIYATSVNPIDWKVREGHLKNRLAFHFPIILGWDAAGIIRKVGAEVEDFEVGDRVFTRPATTEKGTYAEYIAVHQDLVAKLPENIPFTYAAAVPLAGLTAWQCLVDFADIEKGDRVLIHGGAGGVGSFAIQIAKAKGATVMATGRSKSIEIIEQLGADRALNYITDSFDGIKDSFDIVLDTIGGETQEKSYDLLKNGGVLISVAQPPDQGRAKKKGVKAGFVWLEPNGKQLKKLAELMKVGQIKPLIDTVFPFGEKELKEAHEKSQEGHAKGKIVIEIKKEAAGIYDESGALHSGRID
ncbi:NADP-dependent oxidoreductase [Camelliibacillus cellulosilyticus]|uniref:NADP-dependent oxidoreductase n=1 Tax=Camelliibacillus cellulosilyticus TaxID=2174486 RepID=A0ABV9GRZ8_9BACL